MPGRRTKPTFAAIAVAVVVALLVAGYGGSTKDHTWQGEFTERLERASAAMEEAAGELRLHPDQTRGLETLIGLGQKLDSERKSVRRLDPPAACNGVQKAGAKELNQLAYETFLHYKNGTPTLLRRLPRILKEEIAGIGKIEHEAEACG
jgi:hypothetical protein